MSHKRLVTVLRRLWIGYMAFGLSAVASAVPAALAQNPLALDSCKPAETGIEDKEQQTHQVAGSNAGVFVDVPIGTVCVGPDSVDGGPSYVRRTTADKGMTVVEVSSTPFMPVLASNQKPGGGELVARPDQPAPW